MGRALFFFMLCVPLMAAAAADDLKISQLEQEIRTLQRQVQEQSRQLDELRNRLARPADPPRPFAAPAPRVTAGIWLEAARWQRLRPGMTELEVIEALGPPTSIRGDATERVLFYAMEIGTSGFLTGRVTLRDRAVVDVQKPALQ